MKNLLNLNTILLLLGIILWSCNADEIDILESPTALENNIILYGDLQLSPYNGPNANIPLLTNKGNQIGNMNVKNTTTDLIIEFTADECTPFSEVQLWIGIDHQAVPMNKNGIPLTGKFTYKAANQSEYIFTIKLSDILPNYGLLFDELPICIFAHAEMTNNETNKKESGYSAGNSFGTSRWGTYSEFKCQMPPGRGCYPHAADCGVNIDGNFYYDNTIGGEQKIVADNGIEVGVLEYEEDRIYFRLNGDWSICDQNQPPLQYQRYSEPGLPESELISVDPLSSGGPKGYYINVDSSAYYSLDLKIQYCTTR